MSASRRIAQTSEVSQTSEVLLQWVLWDAAVREEQLHLFEKQRFTLVGQFVEILHAVQSLSQAAWAGRPPSSQGLGWINEVALADATCGLDVSLSR